MAEDYRVSLGIDINDKQLSTVKTTINNLVDKERKINLDIDFNIKNADKLASIGREIETIKKSLKELDNVGSIGKGKSILSVDSESLRKSINTIHEDIKKIQNAFGKVDKNKGTQSLLTTVNKIRAALEGVTKQFEGLNANLTALSRKDFNFNLDLSFGSGKKTPEQLTNELRMLKAEAEEYEKHFKTKFPSKTVSGNERSSERAIDKLIYAYGTPQQRAYSLELSNQMYGTGSLEKKITAYKEYIRLIKEVAAVGNLEWEATNKVQHRLSESGDLIKVKNQANEAKESLRELLGGVDASGLKSVLEPISQDIAEIKKAFESLSSIGTIDGLTASFKELSEVLEKLVSNVAIAKSALDDGFKTTSTNDNTEKSIQDQKELAQTSTQSANKVVQNEAKKRQAFRESSNESQKLSDKSEELKRNINFNDDSIDSMRQSFQELGIAIDSVNVNLKNGSLDSFTIKGTDGIERTVTATQKLDDEIIKITQSFAKVNGQAEKIEFKIDTGKFASQISTVEDKFGRLSIKSDDIKTDIKSLQSLFSNMKTSAATGDINELINAYKEYERVLESVNNKLKINNTKQQSSNRQKRQDNSANALVEAKKALTWQIDYYLQNNTAAAKKFGDTIRQIRASIDKCDDSPALKHLESQFNNVKAEANVTLKSTQTFSDRIKKQWQQYSSYFGVASIFMYAEQALRSMFEQVKLIDSAMTELKKVTNETDAAYNEFLSNAADRAKEIGTTIDGLVSSTADFARLGYGFEDAQGLAEVANIYAVVGDEIDGVEQATESLISTMAAFKDEMNGMSNSDFAMSIIDKFNEIGNNFAISSGGIGEALERSASSLMAANNTIDESIALITAANTVVVLCHAA